MKGRIAAKTINRVTWFSADFCGPRTPLISDFVKRVPEALGSPVPLSPGGREAETHGRVFTREILDNPGRQSAARRKGEVWRLTAHPKPPRILFAEDSREQCLLIKYYMQAFPCTVEFAHDGQEAVELFKKNPFPFVFMDMRMPNMDGLSTTRAIRQFEAEQKHGPATIIALTGLSSDSDYERIRAAGCDGILSKPYSKREFMQKMKEVLQIP